MREFYICFYILQLITIISLKFLNFFEPTFLKFLWQKRVWVLKNILIICNRYLSLLIKSQVLAFWLVDQLLWYQKLVSTVNFYSPTQYYKVATTPGNSWKCILLPGKNSWKMVKIRKTPGFFFSQLLQFFMFSYIFVSKLRIYIWFLLNQINFINILLVYLLQAIYIRFYSYNNHNDIHFLACICSLINFDSRIIYPRK